MRQMSPYQISLLMHHHCIRGPFPGKDAPIYESEIQNLVDLKVIESSDMSKSGYFTTELCSAWVRSILSTPVPRVVYVDPRDNAEIVDFANLNDPVDLKDK